eukprot:GHVT01039451.1.p1 GENE.GHVT01039451.1~~GHVT01039451.1.p1  ORF type:complete len:174 (-),score=10.33 GHVT01039451.1:442-963(-)
MGPPPFSAHHHLVNFAQKLHALSRRIRNKKLTKTNLPLTVLKKQKTNHPFSFVGVVQLFGKCNSFRIAKKSRDPPENLATFQNLSSAAVSTTVSASFKHSVLLELIYRDHLCSIVRGCVGSIHRLGGHGYPLSQVERQLELELDALENRRDTRENEVTEFDDFMEFAYIELIK